MVAWANGVIMESHRKEVAVFSIFRRTAEQPFTELKNAQSCAANRANTALSDGWSTLKRGHDLKTVLRVFDKKRIRVV